MKKERSFPVKPRGDGVSCQDARREVGKLSAPSHLRGRGAGRCAAGLSLSSIDSSSSGMHHRPRQPRQRIFRTRLMSRLLCASHVHPTSWERLWIVLYWRVTQRHLRGRWPLVLPLPRWPWAWSNQNSLGWQGWFPFYIFGQASPFMQKICLKLLSKGGYLLGGHLKLMGSFSGLTTCLKSDLL